MQDQTKATKPVTKYSKHWPYTMAHTYSGNAQLSETGYFYLPYGDQN